MYSTKTKPQKTRTAGVIAVSLIVIGALLATLLISPNRAAAHSEGDKAPLISVLHLKPWVDEVTFFDSPDGNEVRLIDFDAVADAETEMTLFETYNENYFHKEPLKDRKIALVVEEFDESGEWARVNVPIRPNGTTHWVQTKYFSKWLHRFHIEIDIAERTISFYNGEDAIFENEPITVGRPTRPTPTDKSYITGFFSDETLPEPYGHTVITTSTFSNTLSTFGGGRRASFILHGTNRPETIGNAVSSGSIRIEADTLTLIADKAPLGTAINIHPGDNSAGDNSAGESTNP